MGRQQAGQESAQVAVVVRHQYATAALCRSRGDRLRLVRQPLQCLVQIRSRASRNRSGVGGFDHLLGRQVTAALAEQDRKLRALAFIARGVELSPVQPDELVNERKADAGARVRARVRALHAVKPLKHLGQLAPGNADARVFHRKARTTRHRRKPHVHSTLERKLERVREQVHHDLFPHVTVDVDRHRKRRAIYREGKARLL